LPSPLEFHASFYQGAKWIVLRKFPTMPFRRQPTTSSSTDGGDVRSGSGRVYLNGGERPRYEPWLLLITSLYVSNGYLGAGLVASAPN
jgi:hypothetical protein